MDRRKFIRNTGIGLTGVAATGLFLNKDVILDLRKDKSKKRPNILFIMTDQQCASAMSNSGNKDLKTPAVDYIANNGMKFQKSYCTTPLCVPSRSSMITGMYPHEINVPINNLDAEWDTNKFPYMGKIMAAAGYDTGYVGKWHLPAKPEDIDTHGFEYIKFALPNRLDPKVAGASREFLMQKRENPFLLVSSFVNPHDICQWARGADMLNDPLAAPPEPELCPELPDNFQIPELEPDIIRKMQDMSKSTYPTKEWSDDKWRQYRWAYFKLVEAVDAHIQDVLDALKESGHEDNTIIIFTSDHGDGNSSHKWNQKQILYEESALIPLIVSWKGVTTANSINNKEVISTGLDLIPTMLDIAGVKQADYLKGKSFMNLALGKKEDDWRKYTIIETEFCQSKRTFDIKGRCVRSDKFKYIVYDKGELTEQLFDMENDPGEMKNLAQNKEYKKIIYKHRKELRKWMKSTNDDFVLKH